MNEPSAIPIQSPGKTRRGSCTGSIYFLVLAVCLLVAMIGVTAVLTARVQLRTLGHSSDSDTARLYARSAIELGAYIANQTNFRTTFNNGTWIRGQPIGDGTFDIAGTNPNGLLGHWDTDPITLTGTGYKGVALHKTQVQLLAHPQPLSCLGVMVDALQNTSLGGSTQGTTTISSNGNITSTASMGATNLEAVGSISNQHPGTGTVTQGISPRLMPSASTVYDYYKKFGTAVSYSSSINSVVLSPTQNDLGGATNPQGIYVIDCRGGNITLSNSRIMGTLVLLNCNTMQISGSMSFAPAVTNFPVLLVQGNAVCNMSNNAVVIGGLLGLLFTTQYPSQIQGLTYVSGNANITGNATLDGALIIGGAATLNATFSLTYESIYASNPPPGFYQTPVPMIMSKSSFAQAVN
jgi:hypothetical protein